MDNVDISGEWTGVYDYPSNEDVAVPFRADLSDINGIISGDVREPNTFVNKVGNELFSLVNGKRDGLSITFLKIYESSEETDSYEIIYEGAINRDITIIQGIWKTTDDLTWSGPFIMNRAQKIELKKDIKQEENIILR